MDVERLGKQIDFGGDKLVELALRGALSADDFNRAAGMAGSVPWWMRENAIWA